MKHSLCRLWGMLAVLLLANLSQAADTARVPILLDTDLGSEVDDGFALALAVASPEIELVGVTTCTSQAEIRAKMALRFLQAVGRKELPVAFGADPQPKSEITGQYRYYYHPAVLYNRAGQPRKEHAVEFLYETLRQRPGEITIVAVGPLTNIARLLKEHPDARPWIKRIVVMGGSFNKDYEGKDKPTAEWNIKTDIPAAQAVFVSGVPLTIVPIDATWNLKLEAAAREKLFAKKSLLTMQVETLYQMWHQETPVLFDPLAIAVVVNDKFCTWQEPRNITITDAGLTVISDDPTKGSFRIATKTDAAKFIPWYVERVVAADKSSLPRELANRTKLITDDKFPARVHTFEDYDTDIEQKWWLSGRLQTDDVPSKGTRACRGQLTLDFDDLQGQLDTMYNAVVFNPVPGPPMGERTRLKFRYKLHGTDQLRIQIYSLTNGYHRYLSLAGLKQDQWQEATVDMTAARRPDGTGGPLSKDERIDDIQFYVDPRAEVLIDDVVLYDAGEEAATRPFPKRILFTGWFDTGKQGVEWPGIFETVPHEAPRTWKYAKSVQREGDKVPQLLVSLRGQRPWAEAVMLEFDYKVTGKIARLPVTLLRDGQELTNLNQQIDDVIPGEWTTAKLVWKSSPAELKQTTAVDAIRFTLPPDATLMIDNVLLYEPQP